MENHPYVDDVEQEIQRIEEEKKKNMELQSKVFNNSGGFNDNHNHDDE